MKRLLSLFPLKFQITQEMINKGSLYLWDALQCIGATALRRAVQDHLLEKETIVWGASMGHIYTTDKNGNDSEYIRIGTLGNINIMDLNEPTEVEYVVIQSKLKEDEPQDMPSVLDTV